MCGFGKREWPEEVFRDGERMNLGGVVVLVMVDVSSSTFLLVAICLSRISTQHVTWNMPYWSATLILKGECVSMSTNQCRRVRPEVGKEIQRGATPGAM